MGNLPDIYKYWNCHFWPFEQNLINKVRWGWNGEVGGQTVQLTENLMSIDL